MKITYKYDYTVKNIIFAIVKYHKIKKDLMMNYIATLLLLTLSLLAESQELKPWAKALSQLTPQERAVIVDKGTERPFSGKYVSTDEKGIYRCKVCNSALYHSNDKFDSHCGWPSFDDAIKGAIKRQKDADGRRTEILCNHCNAHLGHVFEGENMTAKNVRHCVNSISLKFEKAKKPTKAYAYFAGGCFWGVEYYLEKLEGVLAVESGFMGGETKNPSYREVVRGKSGHLESVEVVYDPSKISYEALAKHFFEIHDPTQKDGQGPDIGSQYHSAIFVDSPTERKTIEKLIAQLTSKGYAIATKILPKSSFYRAEEYHQDYYDKNKKEPYCHGFVKRF